MANLLQAENFSDIAEPDPDTLKLIIGQWQIQDSQYVFEFTGQLDRKLFGFNFYQYKSSQKPFSNEFLYAILKIKKYKKSYLCRCIFKNGRPVTFSTSVLQFIGSDWFKVYSQRNPRKLYFEAIRID
jgi:hypothetical protein